MDKEQKNKEKTIKSFRGHYTFLSNFYPSTFTVKLESLSFNFFDLSLFRKNSDKILSLKFTSIEQYYQTFKADNFADFMKVLGTKTAKEAKKKGRKIKIRDDWDKIKLEVMLHGVVRKFIDNRKLRKQLFNTGNAYLIEGNYWHDNYWGICSCAKCQARKIEGKNYLGKILMAVRDYLINNKEQLKILDKEEVANNFVIDFLKRDGVEPAKKTLTNNSIDSEINLS